MPVKTPAELAALRALQAQQQGSVMGGGGILPPGLTMVPGQAPQIPMQMPGLMKAPASIEEAALQYSLGGGPMTAYDPRQGISRPPQDELSAFGQSYTPTRGSYSPAPVIQQSEEDKKAAAEASRNYDLNARGPEYVAQQEAAKAKSEMEAAKAESYTEAYQRGENPELAAKMSSTGSFQMLKDDQGRIVGAWNPKTGRLEKPPMEGMRTGPVSEEQRQGVAGRAVTMDKLLKLGDLAKAHEDKLGPYVSQYVALQMSGTGGPFGVSNADPDVIDMYTTIADLQNARIYEQSGKAINEAEMRRLKQVMPRSDEDSATFWVKYKNFLKEMQDKQYNLGETEATENVPSSAVAPAAPGQKRRIRLNP